MMPSTFVSVVRLEQAPRAEVKPVVDDSEQERGKRPRVRLSKSLGPFPRRCLRIKIINEVNHEPVTRCPFRLGYNTETPMT